MGSINWPEIVSPMDRKNKQNRAQQDEEARVAAILARPAWELMRTTRPLRLIGEGRHWELALGDNFQPEDGDKVIAVPAGTVVMRMNRLPHLQVMYWPDMLLPSHLCPGTVFFPDPEEAGQFNPHMGFELEDDLLTPATDAEEAMPRRCLKCGGEAHKRGLFFCGEPVFLCEADYDPKRPGVWPGDGYSEAARKDRVRAAG